MRPFERIRSHMRCLRCNGEAEALDYGDRWLVRCCDNECPAHAGMVQRKRFMPPSPRVRQNPFWVRRRENQRQMGFWNHLQQRKT